MGKMYSYRPSGFYYRQEAKQTDPKRLSGVILELVEEIEFLRAWVRRQGLIPPNQNLPIGKIKDIVEEPITDFQNQLSLNLKPRD